MVLCSCSPCPACPGLLDQEGLPSLQPWPRLLSQSAISSAATTREKAPLVEQQRQQGQAALLAVASQGACHAFLCSALLQLLSGAKNGEGLCR